MTDQEKKPLRLKDKIQIAALTVILVVFPAVSWYWLSQGLDYRKTAKAELKDLGPLPDHQWRNYTGRTLSKTDLKGSFVIAGVYDLSQPQLSDYFGREFSRLHDQFDDRKDVFFFSVIGQDTALLPAFLEKYGLTDTTQCFFFTTEPEAMKNLAVTGFRMPALDGTSSPYIAFADTSSVIRNHYNVRDNQQLKRMVQHISLLLPMSKSREELRFQREAEK
ncbi:MAG: hypothetical protein HUU01_10555 [Saprospiraceae bacterium]|nr:hypothetical protein [Saprospiraceae bacterium]